MKNDCIDDGFAQENDGQGDDFGRMNRTDGFDDALVPDALVHNTEKCGLDAHFLNDGVLDYGGVRQNVVCIADDDSSTCVINSNGDCSHGAFHALKEYLKSSLDDSDHASKRDGFIRQLSATFSLKKSDPLYIELLGQSTTALLSDNSFNCDPVVFERAHALHESGLERILDLSNGAENRFSMKQRQRICRISSRLYMMTYDMKWLASKYPHKCEILQSGHCDYDSVKCLQSEIMALSKRLISDPAAARYVDMIGKYQSSMLDFIARNYPDLLVSAYGNIIYVNRRIFTITKDLDLASRIKKDTIKLAKMTGDRHGELVMLRENAMQTFCLTKDSYWGAELYSMLDGGVTCAEKNNLALTKSNIDKADLGAELFSLTKDLVWAKRSCDEYNKALSFVVNPDWGLDFSERLERVCMEAFKLTRDYMWVESAKHGYNVMSCKHIPISAKKTIDKRIKRINREYLDMKSM